MNELVKIVGLLGIGGIVSAYFTMRWQRKNRDTEKRQEYKETRYKCIVLLMKALVEFDKYRPMLNNHGYQITSQNELVDLLRDEQLTSLLYASQGFIEAFGHFISSPDKASLLEAVLEMRKDLWGLGGKLEEKQLFGMET